MPATDTRSDLRPDFGLVRLYLIVGGCAALGWSTVALPAFWSERTITGAGRSIAAGESYRPQVLENIDARLDDGGVKRLRSAALGKAVMVRIRRAEVAMRDTNTAQTDRSLVALVETIERGVANAPLDSFLWLAKFWVENARSGFVPDHIRYLQISYELGLREGWVALKRNRYAITMLAELPPALADQMVAEYAAFVRWGLVADAADIVAGPGRAARAQLFGALKGMSEEYRRPLSREIYRRGLEDVPVPGIEFPKPPWAVKLDSLFNTQKSLDENRQK